MTLNQDRILISNDWVSNQKPLKDFKLKSYSVSDEETIKSESIEMLPKVNLDNPLSIRSISFEDDLLSKRGSF